MESTVTDRNIFEIASRQKLRFPSDVGDLTVEDLWDLPLSTTSTRKASLEKVGNALLLRQKEFAETTILTSTRPSPEKTLVDLSVEVIRHIVQVREAENRAKTEAASKKAEADRLDQLIAEREISEASLDDLKARRAALST